MNCFDCTLQSLQRCGECRRLNSNVIQLEPVCRLFHSEFDGQPLTNAVWEALPTGKRPLRGRDGISRSYLSEHHFWIVTPHSDKYVCNQFKKKKKKKACLKSPGENICVSGLTGKESFVWTVFIQPLCMKVDVITVNDSSFHPIFDCIFSIMSFFFFLFFFFLWGNNFFYLTYF